MTTNELPKNWTEKQRQAYEMLKASVERNSVDRQVAFSNGTPKGGWDKKDRIEK